MTYSSCHEKVIRQKDILLILTESVSSFDAHKQSSRPVPSRGVGCGVWGVCNTPEANYRFLNIKVLSANI